LYSRTLISKETKVVYVQKKPHHKLADGFPYLIPSSSYHEASGSSRFGDALAVLLPHLFSGNDLRQPSIKDLDQDKAAALIGTVVFCLSSSFISSSFEIPFYVTNSKITNLIGIE